MILNSIMTIARATRIKSTIAPQKRTQYELVSSDQQQQDMFHSVITQTILYFFIESPYKSSGSINGSASITTSLFLTTLKKQFLRPV